MEKTTYHEILGTGLDIAKTVINGLRRVMNPEQENTGGAPALDRALYDTPTLPFTDGGRWDDMGRY